MSNAIYPANVKGLTFTVMKTAEFKTIVQDSPSGYQTRISQTTNPIWHFELVYDYLYDTYLSPQNTQAYAPFTDLQTMLGFFTARQGQFDDFLFLDPTDYSALGLRSGTWRRSTAYPTGAVIVDWKGHAQFVTTAGTSGPGPYPPNFSITGGTTADGSITWTDLGYFPNGWDGATVPLSIVTDGNGNYYSPIQRNIGGLVFEDVTDLVPNTLQVYNNGVLVTGSSTPSYTVQGPGLAVPGAAYMGLYLKWSAQPTGPITAVFHFYFRVRFEEDTQDFERWAQGLWTIGGSSSKNGAGYVKLVSSRPVGA